MITFALKAGGLNLQVDSFVAPEDGFIVGVNFYASYACVTGAGRFGAMISLQSDLSGATGAALVDGPVGQNHIAYCGQQVAALFSAGGSMMAAEGVNLFVPSRTQVSAGQKVFLYTNSATNGILCIAFVQFEPASFFLRKRGHVSPVIPEARPLIFETRPIGLSLGIPRKQLLTSQVVTLWDAREAIQSAVGQLLYAGEVINKHAELWEQVVIGVGDNARPFPGVANELTAELIVSLLDGYYSQGFGYIQNHLGGFGQFTLRSGRKLEDKFPDFKDLIEDPLSLGVRELIERALSQKKPRQWITAHFRSRSVAGLLEKTS